MSEHSKINLLFDQSGSSYAQLLTKLRVLRVVAIGLLFLVGTASIMLFLMIALSPLPRLRAEEERLTDTIKSGSYQSKMDKYFIISSRLKDINTVLAQRPDVVKTYELLESTLAGSVKINFLDITEKNISLNLYSNNLAELESVTTNLREIPEYTKSFKAMTLSGIAYDKEDLFYRMVVTITL